MLIIETLLNKNQVVWVKVKVEVHVTIIKLNGFRMLIVNP